MSVQDHSHLLQPGFAEPVLDAQVSFRAALNASAEPGTRQVLDNANALGNLDAATYSLCLALLDSDTPLWLAECFNTPAIRANLSFHCGCPIVSERERAMFALLDEAALSDLSAFDTGSERFPDQSCTLLIQLSRLDGGTTLAWSGPGIQIQRLLDLPLPTTFWQQRARCNDFPRGLDCLFTAGEHVIALPRSTRIDYANEESA